MKNKSQKYLIFDFDGVLVDSLEQIAVAIKQIYKRFSFLPISTIKFGIVEYMDFPKHAKKNHLSLKKQQQTIKDLQEAGQVMITNNKVLPFSGFIKQLKTLRNCRMAIVSSGYEDYINHFAKPLSLPFEQILGVETSLSKEEKVNLICKKWSINVKNCYYFTDTKSDVIELEQILDKNKIIGCGWGWQGKKKLELVLPNSQIMVNFTDINDILK